jgi:Leucine-rich repeat (LRR) protein
MVTEEQINNLKQLFESFDIENQKLGVELSKGLGLYDEYFGKFSEYLDEDKMLAVYCQGATTILPKNFYDFYKHYDISPIYEEFPNIFSEIYSLRSLKIKRFSVKFENLQNFENLIRLRFDKCRIFIDENFLKLKKLEFIEFSDCEIFIKDCVKLSELKNLKELEIHNVKVLDGFCNFLQFDNLDRVLFENFDMDKLTLINDAPNLECFVLINCKNVENFDFNKLKNVKGLTIKNTKLTNLENIKNLDLDSLTITDCELEDSEFDFWNFKNLEVLNLRNNNLTKLPKGLGKLKNLTYLNLQYTEIEDSLLENLLENIQNGTYTEN